MTRMRRSEDSLQPRQGRDLGGKECIVADLSLWASSWLSFCWPTIASPAGSMDLEQDRLWLLHLRSRGPRLWSTGGTV